MPEITEPVAKLRKDIIEAARTLGIKEARFLVDRYYEIQDKRISTNNQTKALAKTGEPNAVLAWFTNQDEHLEKQMVKVLDAFSDSDPLGNYLRLNPGIGPVLSAGLIAHVAPEKFKTAGALHRFAGLDVNLEWLGTAKAASLVSTTATEIGSDNPNEVLIACAAKLKRRPELILNMAMLAKRRGDITPEQLEEIRASYKLTMVDLKAALARRPWNATLKMICWRAAECFLKLSGNPKAHYGQMYANRKAMEIQRNNDGLYAEQAKMYLQKKNYSTDTEAYKAYIVGRLPDAHITARARHYVMKMLLSHLHEIGTFIRTGNLAPHPYVLVYGGHSNYVPPPFADQVPGFMEAKKIQIANLQQAKTTKTNYDNDELSDEAGFWEDNS